MTPGDVGGYLAAGYGSVVVVLVAYSILIVRRRSRLERRLAATAAPGRGPAGEGAGGT